VQTANQYGFDYVELKDLNTRPLIELVDRLMALKPLQPAQREQLLPALWGHHPTPTDATLLSELPEICQSIQATVLMRKSPEQRQKWRRLRDLAVTTFINVIGGDKKLVDLTTDDVDKLRDHWKNRILAREVEIDTANKNIGQIAAMFREVNDEKRLKLDDVFARSRIKGGEKKKRVAFNIQYVQDILLADGTMDGLNDEARAIFYVVAETGMRPSEVAGLTSDTILLNHLVPHVRIIEDGRALKTTHSRRQLPLVGLALEVMKHFPDGFPYYRHRTATLSTTINKYLRENHLCPVEGQSFYSLRHTFKDRLRAVDNDKELRDMLMGHTTDKEDYGDGHTLKRKQEVFLKMAFKPPRLSFAEGAGRGPQRHRAARAQQRPRAGGTLKRKPSRAAQATPPRPAKRSQAVPTESDGHHH
jgi:integrase